MSTDNEPIKDKFLVFLEEEIEEAKNILVKLREQLEIREEIEKEINKDDFRANLILIILKESVSDEQEILRLLNRIKTEYLEFLKEVK